VVGRELARHLVFTAPEGGVLRSTNFRPRFFDPAAEKVGLLGLTPHVLRHTAASLAIAAGANVKAVQLMLGHASAAMTLDISVRASSPMTSTLLRTGLTGRS
jgi:integrase